MPTGNQQFDDDEYDDDELEGSKLVRDLRRQLKELSRENASLKEVNGTLSVKDRQRTLSDALTAKGLSEKAAKFYPADAELTPEAIDAWVSDNADIFGTVKPANEAPTSEDPGEGQAPVGQSVEAPAFVDADSEAAFRRMQAANLVGTSGTTRDQEVLRGIANAKTPEELTEFLRSARTSA